MASAPRRTSSPRPCNHRSTQARSAPDVRTAITRHREALGETMVRTVLGVWEHLENREALVALTRSALTNAAAQAMVDDDLGGKIFGPVTEALAVREGQLRASLIGSQFIGLAITRYVTRLEPIASASPEQIVEPPRVQWRLSCLCLSSASVAAA